MCVCSPLKRRGERGVGLSRGCKVECRAVGGSLSTGYACCLHNKTDSRAKWMPERAAQYWDGPSVSVPCNSSSTGFGRTSGAASCGHGRSKHLHSADGQCSRDARKTTSHEYAPVKCVSMLESWPDTNTVLLFVIPHNYMYL